MGRAQLIERPITPQALRYVLAHLWPRGVEELRLLGVTKDGAYSRFLSYARHPWGHTPCVLEFDGVPAVVFGVSGDDGGAFTWFQATDAFEQYAGEITRYIRREAKAYTVPLFIYSVCVHPDTARWFRVLGFAPTEKVRELPSGALLRQFERVRADVRAAA